MNHAVAFLLLVGLPAALLAITVWFGPILSQPYWAIVAAATIISVCIALVVYGLLFAVAGPTTSKLALERSIGNLLMPAFIALPAASSYIATSLVRRTGVALGSVRVCGGLTGIAAFFLGSIGAVTAGCALAGACF